jgi:hypothetical protein
MRSRLRYQHETIGELIGTLTELQLRQRIDPTKWSAFENIAHLACYHPVFLNRIQRISEENNPHISRYVAETDPEFPAYVQQSLPRLLGEIRSNRRMLIDLLEGLNETGLERMGEHARYGRLTLTQWLEFFLLHEAHHLYAIFMLVQDLRRNLPE